MNQLIPKYSFIKLFISHAKNYKFNICTYTNHHIQKYNDKFTINNMRIDSSIIIREEYRLNNTDYNSTYYNYIKTDMNLYFNNNHINEVIKINYSHDLFKIDYILKNNDIIIENIDIPKFIVYDYNYNILLQNYKFVDKTIDKNNYYKLILEIEKNLK